MVNAHLRQTIVRVIQNGGEIRMKKWIRHRLWEHRKRKFCKLNGFFCPECIYHNWIWSGTVFRGNRCSYPWKVGEIRIMKKLELFTRKKISSFLQTCAHGSIYIGIGLLSITGLIAIAMGFVIVYMDATGFWTFKWWHLIYWIIDLFTSLFLMGKIGSDD